MELALEAGKFYDMNNKSIAESASAIYDWIKDSDKLEEGERSHVNGNDTDDSLYEDGPF